MVSKSAVTATIIELLAEQPPPLLQQAMQDWWQNPKPSAGLRLTAQGFFVFCLVQIEHYCFALPPGIHSRARTLLTLDRKMTCPYYLTTKKDPEIYIFGAKEANMFALYGDVERFLRGIAR